MIHNSDNMTHRLLNIIYHLSFIFIATISLFLILSPIPTLASSKILQVPHTSQAPYGYWGQPWQDTCEEASILMVDKYYSKPGDYKITKKEAKEALLKILQVKKKYFGRSLDENAEKITNLINNFYNWEAKIVDNPTLEMIKNEIDNNKPVIVPLYGKALKNQFFLNNGPYYHVLVISGYDEEKKEFITQEPGLNIKGLDFRYKYDTIMNAIHDLTDNKKLTKNGRKVAIFTQKELATSAEIDADKDGLTKKEELAFKTFPWSKDTDNDGYNDKMEIDNGYSPIKPAKKK